MKNYFSGRSPIKVFSNYFCFMYYDECVKGNTKELFMVPNLMIDAATCIPLFGTELILKH